jgi:hypothetical protein
MQTHLESILSPNTVFKHRKELLFRLQSAYPHLEEPQYNPLAGVQAGKYVIDVREKKSILEKLNRKFKQVIGGWIGRARRLIKIRAQVGGVLEQITEPYCLHCGRDYSLKCESIGNIEDLFEQFMREQKQPKSKHWVVERWQLYYLQNSVFRTLCQKCYSEEYLPKRRLVED